MAKDVSNFIRWTAEPEYDDRRVYYWKIMSTFSLYFVLFNHVAQKQQTWKIFQRLTWRYWKNTCDK